TPHSSFSSRYPHPRDLHSFPTRRSSDLARRQLRFFLRILQRHFVRVDEMTERHHHPFECRTQIRRVSLRSLHGLHADCHQMPPRSEEHTSELQSRGHLVCRLLLEKKKKN